MTASLPPLSRRTIDLPGRRVSCLLRPGTPRLVLLHGSHQDSRQWAGVIENLRQDLGLVIVELAGHGQSAGLPVDLSIERLAADVFEVLDACGPGEVFVGGHSLGGMVALEMGRSRPGRIKGIISVEGWTNHHAAREAFSERMYDTLTPPQRALQEDLRRQATGHLSDEQRQAISSIWRCWDGWDFLQATDLAILECWGDRGGPRPSLSQLHIPARANIEVRWFANASHNLPLERPAELAQAMTAFLASVA